MPKTKVGEFFKLYNIALGLQVQKLKIYIFTHKFLNKSRIWIAFVLEM
jgi:hypothetical protein